MITKDQGRGQEFATGDKTGSGGLPQRGPGAEPRWGLGAKPETNANFHLRRGHAPMSPLATPLLKLPPHLKRVVSTLHYLVNISIQKLTKYFTDWCSHAFEPAIRSSIIIVLQKYR